MRRGAERGVVLINVLVILALTASVVYAMVSLSELSITRSQRYSAAGQALALIAAGETSAIVALRRDMREAPGTDHPGEPWALAGQEPVAIAGGSFALTIEDAQAKLNLNALPMMGALGAQIVQRMIVALELPPDVAPRIAARLAMAEPLGGLSDLVAEAGLTATEVARLGTLATVLPGRTDINVNTAPEALLGILTDNPVQAANLAGIRKRKGFLTPADIAGARTVLPPGTGFTSRYFAVTVTVTLDGVSQRATALLQRRPGGPGGPAVTVIGRDLTGAPLPPE